MRFEIFFSLKVILVPTMEAERCCDMLEAVIEGSVESLMTINDVVVGRMPKVRKEDAIYSLLDQSLGRAELACAIVKNNCIRWHHS